MLDFAASLLAELEKWMSSASTAMVDLSSYADSDRFIGPASMVVDIQRRLYTDEVRPWDQSGCAGAHMLCEQAPDTCLPPWLRTSTAACTPMRLALVMCMDRLQRT